VTLADDRGSGWIKRRTLDRDETIIYFRGPDYRLSKLHVASGVDICHRLCSQAALRGEHNELAKLSARRLVLCWHQRSVRGTCRPQSVAQPWLHCRWVADHGFLRRYWGGVSRDLLLNVIPSPIKDPTYLFVCLLMGLLGLAIYRYLDSREERFRTRTLAFFKSFTLPWFAILGAHKALEHDLGIFSAIVVGLIATTAGGVFIDLFSGVTPELVRPSEQLVTTAVLASTVYTVLASLEKGKAFFPVTLIAVLVAFVFRVVAVREHFPSIVPLEASSEGPVAHA
jgi:uncharacterized membrane protein YeiH